MIRRLVELDVRRSDYERTPGRTAELRVGPFTFGVDTADTGRIGFSIALGPWGFVWSMGWGGM